MISMRQFLAALACLLSATAYAQPAPASVPACPGTGTTSDELKASVTCELARHTTGVTKSPQLIEAEPPVMPRYAAHAGISGEVQIEFTVDSSGRVAEIRILHSADRMLSDAVRYAVKHWVFSPMIVDGQPREFVNRQTFEFPAK